jgi:hypothetical protein
MFKRTPSDRRERPGGGSLGVSGPLEKRGFTTFEPHPHGLGPCESRERRSRTGAFQGPKHPAGRRPPHPTNPLLFHPLIFTISPRLWAPFNTIKLCKRSSSVKPSLASIKFGRLRDDGLRLNCIGSVGPSEVTGDLALASAVNTIGKYGLGVKGHGPDCCSVNSLIAASHPLEPQLGGPDEAALLLEDP